MNDWVEDANDRRLVSRIVFEEGPCDSQCRNMMINVQDRHLILFLAKNEEDGVQQIDDFVEEINPETAVSLSRTSVKTIYK